jgi:hypothetical protein
MGKKSFIFKVLATFYKNQIHMEALFSFILNRNLKHYICQFGKKINVLRDLQI